MNSSLRSTLLLGAATVAAVSLAAPASAQTSMETVVVTGSRIPQVGVISPSPVGVVSQEEINIEGTTDIGRLLNNQPSVYAGQTSGAGNGSTGTVTVNLRGLGSARTLVLIDGKRLAPGDAEVPVPDLNQIPAALVDRVELQTGGASATYGSDALAGVVNFIMRRDFEGVEVDAKFAGYQHDNGNTFARSLQDDAGFTKAPSSVFDGVSFDDTLIVGTNTANGKGNITIYAGYQRQNQVLQRARDFSACSISAYYSTDPTLYDYFVCAGSSNYSRFRSYNGPHPSTTYFIEPGGNIVPRSSLPPSETTFNYGAYNTLIRPQTRWTGGAFAHYEVDKMLDVYADFMFMDNHNSWQAAPSAAFTSSGYQFQYGFPYNYNTNCDNPLLTAQFVTLMCPGGVRSTADAHLLIGRRNVEGGPRITDFRHTSYRIVVGAKGELGDGWTYDVSGQEGITLYQQLYLHDWSIQRIQNALEVNPNGTCKTDTSNGCVPLDLFHGIGAITTDMLNYVYSHGQRTGHTDEMVLSGSITGDLGQYGFKSPWAPDGVGLNFGAEYRKEVLEEITSTADYSGDLSGAGGKALGQPKAGFSVWEIFGETRIPLVHGAEMMEDFSLNAGYRYSEYSIAGAARSYKIGFEYQPVDDFRIRASMQRAVRAPNVLEMFQPQNVILGSFTDACAGANPSASLANCVASGLPAAQYGHVDQCVSNQCNYLFGGNTALKPEESDTRTIGVVLTPTFLSGFQATIDYFNIAVNKYINNIPPSVVMAGCTSGQNPTMCQYFHRDSSGTVATPNGYVVATLVNTGYLKTSGVDFEAHYLTDLTDIGMGDNGTLSASMVATWVNDFRVQPYTGASADAGGKTFIDYNCVGLYGVSCGTPTPAWRHTFRVTWSTPIDLDVSLGWRHMSGSKFDGNDPNPYIQLPITIGGDAIAHIADFDYLDVGVSWSALKNVNVAFGVNNVLDRSPPMLSSGGQTQGPTAWLNGNTFNGVFDSLGRYMFFNITLKS